ncbi:MAG: type II secretion system F family protein [Firmicutes bacterium]|nr:type II secretion system F family protein [Bacillota bacterium]
MPFFKYVGQSKNQKLIRGWIEAIGPGLAIEKLIAVGLRVLEIKPAGFLFTNLTKGFYRVKDDSIYLMTRAFGTLISSGMPVFEAIRILFENEENDTLKRALMTVLYDIRNGSSISWAMTKHPKIFSPIYLGLIKVGETTGELGLMLQRLSNFLEEDIRIKRMIKAALIYPAFIFLFCLGAAFITFHYVLPALLGSITSVSTSLPLPTRILCFLVNTGHNPYFQLVLISGLISYVVFLKQWLNKPENKLKVDKLKVDLPVIGPLNRKFLSAQFFRSLGLFLTSGFPILKALSLLTDYSENAYFTKFIILPLTEEIKNGGYISTALAKNLDFFQWVPAQMVNAGEEVGEVPFMLTKVAAIYDADIAYSLDMFIVLLEPFLITVMGLVVGFIILAIFMPLYQFILKLA